MHGYVHSQGDIYSVAVVQGLKLTEKVLSEIEGGEQL